jgi:spore coat protein JB
MEKLRPNAVNNNVVRPNAVNNNVVRPNAVAQSMPTAPIAPIAPAVPTAPYTANMNVARPNNVVPAQSVAPVQQEKVVTTYPTLPERETVVNNYKETISRPNDYQNSFNKENVINNYSNVVDVTETVNNYVRPPVIQQPVVNNYLEANVVKKQNDCSNLLNRREIIDEIKALNFAIIELGLYLDTHPEDLRAAHMHKDYCKKLRELKDKYQRVYGPLSIYYPCNKWRWVEEPWTWERGNY